MVGLLGNMALDNLFSQLPVVNLMCYMSRMEVKFTLPETAAQLLLRLASCIRQNSEHAPSVDEIARSLIIEILIDDAQSHGVIDRPRLVS